jgi:AUX/IAA family
LHALFVLDYRNAAAPVVGWPPVRSFRKNIASSSKQLPEAQNHNQINPTANGKKGNYVKINMDGIPIGRKVDLTAYDSYAQLCLAVKDLFKGLLDGTCFILFLLVVLMRNVRIYFIALSMTLCAISV